MNEEAEFRKNKRIFAHVKNDEHCGRYFGGKSPKKAARKIANRLLKNKEPNSTVKFKIVQKTYGNSHNKCYVYTAKRIVLDNPRVVKLRNDKTITYKYMIDCKRVLAKDFHEFIDDYAN